MSSRPAPTHINLAEKLGSFSEHWAPKIVARYIFLSLGGLFGVGMIWMYHAGSLTHAEFQYALLVTVDYPDALTGGLRRTTDALRPVLERTRGDLTTTFLQQRLQRAIEARLPE